MNVQKPMPAHRWLPSFAPMAGITLFGHVFVQRTVDEGTLAHEAVHVAQQRRDGWRFYLRYAFSARWRVRYEAEAYAVNFRNGGRLERLARTLAGPLYLWPCTVEEARAGILAAAAPAA